MSALWAEREICLGREGERAHNVNSRTRSVPCDRGLSTSQAVLFQRRTCAVFLAQSVPSDDECSEMRKSEMNAESSGTSRMMHENQRDVF